MRWEDIVKTLSLCELITNSARLQSSLSVIVNNRYLCLGAHIAFIYLLLQTWYYKLQRSVHCVNLSAFQLVAERVRRERINWVSVTVAVRSWLSKSATCIDSCRLNCRRCATDRVLNYWWNAILRNYFLLNTFWARYEAPY